MLVYVISYGALVGALLFTGLRFFFDKPHQLIPLRLPQRIKLPEKTKRV